MRQFFVSFAEGFWGAAYYVIPPVVFVLGLLSIVVEVVAR
jgi:hypothetical protein